MIDKGTFKSSLARYLAIAGVYLVCLVTLKVVEFFALEGGALGSGKILVNALVVNLIVASWTVLGIGVLYWLIQLLSQKAARVVAAVLYALLLLAEVGLTLYVAHNGYLLGCELVARPFSETFMAIKGAMGIVKPVVLILLLIGGFTALGLWRAKHPTRGAWVVVVVAGVMILLSLIFKMSHLIEEGYDHYILNKTHYLIADCHEYYHRSRLHQREEMELTEYNEAWVHDLNATHPEWGIPPDPHYPLERATSADTFLSPYFASGETGASAPNIVIILVESLGAEIMGTGAMPFVDSLAATGLYWRNCLSTTTRSYGAIPAITGSVGGPKCFQFGSMPNHNSLFSLLKSAGYNTRAYYAGDFNFDCIYEYLTAQSIDYLSPMFEEFVAAPTENGAGNWGYADDSLFARTLKDLEQYQQRKPSDPHISLVTTLSMHEELKLTDKGRQKEYERRAARLSKTQAGDYLAALFPSCLFTDDCLRDFIHSYGHLPGYENTLFVITGDHATGRQKGDKLSFHHVPLILWSPLIRQPATFTHVVTHNDVAPALYSLLATKYHLPTHPTVHWLGDGLGPTPKTLLVVNYHHTIHDIVFHNYYYQSASQFAPEKLYSFGNDLLLHPCSDTAILDTCRRQLQLMRYLYSYTYLTNHLTAHPTTKRPVFITSDIFIAPDVVYVGPDASSPQPCYRYTILPTKRFRSKPEYRYVSITLDADATVPEGLLPEQYPDLFIYCVGDNKQHYGEPLYKLFSDETHVSVTKEFPLGETGINELKIDLQAPYSKDNWLAGFRIALSNIQITLKYGK